MTHTLTIRQPDDWHLHLRDGAALATTVPHSAANFARAIVMPNLIPPIVKVDDALAYQARIKQHLPPDTSFQPLMALYLTPDTTAEDVAIAAQAKDIIGYKWYPAGSTTNSQFGVHNIAAMPATISALARLQVPLLIHGEVTDERVDIFDREAVFIETILRELLHQHPTLPVVLEHITTKEAVKFVEEAPANVAATITAHHLLSNRNDLLAGGIKPHYYCLPVLKRETDRRALLTAACSGNPKFFLGTDSAPHALERKEAACGCAGIYTAPIALQLYASAFASQQALDKLENFASVFGANFYGLPLNEGSITLRQESWLVPDSYALAESQVVPFAAGEEIGWVIGERSE